MNSMSGLARDSWGYLIRRRRVVDAGGVECRGHWHIIHRRGGRILRDIHVNNLIVNVGLDAIKTGIFDAPPVTPFLYVALGSGVTATSAGSTELVTEWVTFGLERKLGVYSSGGTGIAQIAPATAWTCSGDGKVVNEFGLFNGAGVGTTSMFARVSSTGDAEFSTITLDTSDQLELAVTMTFSAGATTVT